MGLGAKAWHHLIWRFQAATLRDFRAQSQALEATQRQVLAGILEHCQATTQAAALGVNDRTSYEDFAQRVPVQGYDGFRAAIDGQKAGTGTLITPACQKYQPTSGSTSQRKWIPYNPKILAEMNRAIAAWLADLYSANPGIRSGKHYWSLSWLPTELRQSVQNLDDLSYFPWWKKLILGQTMAVPNAVSLLPSLAWSKHATMAYLAAARDLTFISVWSPTFLITLLDELVVKRLELAQELSSGRWTASFGALPCPTAERAATILRSKAAENPASLCRALWPDLALISAWDTSTSAPLAEELRALFPQVRFQGKGLFATEAVVTIPVDNSYQLAYQSHFYEFLRAGSDLPVPAWALSLGDVVRPVVTTGNGLFRYKMDDWLRVTGFAGEIPALDFIGRESTSDLVGEKLSHATLSAVLDQDGKGWPGFFAAVRGRVSHYVLVADQALPISAAEVEAKLLTNFHYQLARELGQLGPCQVRACPGAARALYLDLACANGMIEGDIKMQPVLLTTDQGFAKSYEKLSASRAV